MHEWFRCGLGVDCRHEFRHEIDVNLALEIAYTKLWIDWGESLGVY